MLYSETPYKMSDTYVQRVTTHLETADKEAINFHKTWLKKNPRIICYSLATFSLVHSSYDLFFLSYDSRFHRSVSTSLHRRRSN